MIPVYSSSTSPLSSSGLVDSAEISLLHNEPAETDNGMNDLTLCMHVSLEMLTPVQLYIHSSITANIMYAKKFKKFGQYQEILLHLLPTSLLIYCQFVR